MLYEYVFYAGLVNQRFRIFSGPARRPVSCNHSKVSEINLSNLTFVVEYEEGDFMEMMTVRTQCKLLKSKSLFVKSMKAN